MQVATSILTANFNELEKEIKALENSDYLHLDVMDGHFVPNISFGYPVLKNLPKITKVPLDIHLMVTNPSIFIEDFIKLKPEFITIHLEANKPLETIMKIKNNQIKAGISLKPNTPVEALKPYLNLVDLILIMTVEPGFGGQSFLKKQVAKIKQLDKLRNENNYRYLIEVDGGVNDKTINFLKKSGCDIVVSGSFILNHDNKAEAIQALK
ncbi:MAG: ribulose-phosphate 3-epimerase [Acholeplasmataceae bacterium]